MPIVEERKVKKRSNPPKKLEKEKDMADGYNRDIPPPKAPGVGQLIRSKPPPGPQAQKPLTNKALVKIAAKKASEIAHAQYSGSPLLVDARRCRCKKSKCLKLYCECFAAHIYCTPGTCGCAECNNLPAFETGRVAAIESALSRNMDAFSNKVTKAEKRAAMTSSDGCNCRKSLCLKKYCECFFTGMLCTPSCKCTNCENYAGSSALAAKREQMRREEENAELAKTMGTVAAQAVRDNGADIEEAKRAAEKARIEAERLRNEAALMRRQSEEEKARRLSEEEVARENGSINSTVPMKQMVGQKPSSFRERKPACVTLDRATSLTQDDWEYAASLAAEADVTDGLGGLDLDYRGGVDPLDSTRSRPSPAHKKGRLFSPKTTEFLLSTVEDEVFNFDDAAGV